MPLDDAHLAPCGCEMAHRLLSDCPVAANDAVDTHVMTLRAETFACPMFTPSTLTSQVHYVNIKT
jgi:hypothetical protein